MRKISLLAVALVVVFEVAAQMKFFVISTGVVKGKDGEPAKDVTHPVKAGAEAFAKLFIGDVTSRKLAVSKMFTP